MNPSPVFRSVLLVLALLSGLSTPLTAQNVLYAELDGKILPVVQVRRNQPYVEVAGKPVAIYGHRFALHKTAEYLPVFIAVRDLDVRTSYLDLNGSHINNDFLFNATLETAYWLEDVFIVLELDTETAGKVLFIQGVGQMKAREPRWMSIRVPMGSGLGSGHYQVHLFTRGMEVLHSEIPAMYREEVVDRMTAKRIASVQDAAPKFFIGPGPEYPAALLKADIKGEAVISLRIGANGRVYDPAVKSASDPAFGVTALTAVRLWRFLPRVKGGRPVETSVDLPIEFTPPEKPAGKS